MSEGPDHAVSVRPSVDDEGAPKDPTCEDGIITFKLSGWAVFADFLQSRVFIQRGRSLHRHIWRGQRCSDWPLSSSLDRLFDRLRFTGTEQTSLESRSQQHLEDFKYAARGRRGASPQTLDENEWWALGQHFGLATPLLDWSHSPYAAAYFAFEEPEPKTPCRVVFGLDRDAVQAKNVEIISSPIEGRSPILELIDPLSDENPRLVSQGALFTRAPIGVSVEQWVRTNFADSLAPVLMRIEIPEAERPQALRALDLMNINHLSLFPT